MRKSRNIAPDRTLRPNPQRLHEILYQGIMR
jgi:hypothetical protein